MLNFYSLNIKQLHKIYFKTRIFFSVYLFTLALAGFSGCSNDTSCINQSKVSGDIVSEIDLGVCYNLMQSDTIIITDTATFLDLKNRIDADYYALFKTKCDTLRDTIDFSTYSIIGYFSNGFGCNVNFHKDFFIDKASKKYFYTITIEECGDCTIEEFSMNWIIVPKLDLTYTFIFDKKNEK